MLKKLTEKESADKIIKYIKDKDKPTRTIGLLAKAKGIVFENNIQLNKFYKRHIRAAKELDCYSTEKIISTMKYLIDHVNFKWELSSVSKYIDENLYKLIGVEPIIKLKNGEQIYSVERIKQLERDGKVYYDTKWKEIP